MDYSPSRGFPHGRRGGGRPPFMFMPPNAPQNMQPNMPPNMPQGFNNAQAPSSPQGFAMPNQGASAARSAAPQPQPQPQGAYSDPSVKFEPFSPEMMKKPEYGYSRSGAAEPEAGARADKPAHADKVAESIMQNERNAHEYYKLAAAKWGDGVFEEMKRRAGGRLADIKRVFSAVSPLETDLALPMDKDEALRFAIGEESATINIISDRIAENPAGADALNRLLCRKIADLALLIVNNTNRSYKP